MADLKNCFEQEDCNAPAIDAEEAVSSSKSVDSFSEPAAPLLKRVENLELNLRALEVRFSPRSVVEGNSCLSGASAGSTRSSCLSTPSSAVDQRRKPIDDVLEETEEKGSLVERVASLEVRLDSLNMQVARGDWTPTQVPQLKAPPARVAKNVAAVAPSDFPAETQEDEHNKHKKRHHASISYMFKNCLHPSSH